MFHKSLNLPRLFGFLLFVGMMAAGYYYNLTFVQLGLEDFGTSVLGLSAQAVARDMALLALMTCFIAIAFGWWMQRLGWGRNFRLKLRLSFGVVLVQALLTFICPMVSNETGFILWLGGGSFHPSPGSVIEGRVNTGAGVSLPSVPERETAADLSFWIRAILNGLLSGLIAAALVRYFPSAVGRISEAITHHSLASGAMGILVGIVGISLLVTMAYTILLIPVSILMLFLLAVGVFLGWVGLGNELGRLLVRASKRPIKPAMAAFIGIFIFMPAFQFITSIPMLGGLLGIAFGSVGLGSVALTRFGLRRFVPATEENLSE
ncbi:hypothetical protein FBQ99_22215 [Chloroflexi bacterium CFX2]|nr:hypothetical protein [Chloroflexi bacterium CFX2]